MDNLLTSNNDTLFRTTVTDTFSIWIQRAAQCCTADESSKPLIGRVLSDQDADLIFDYVCDFWTDSGAALGNALKDLFKKTIDLLAKVRTPDKLAQLLQGWAFKVLGFPRTMRVIYFTLEILSKYIGGNFILTSDPKFLESTLKLMSSNALANPAGRCLFAVYHNISRDGNWVSLWAPKCREVLLSHEPSTQHILTYFLPLMFRLHPASLNEFISPLKRAKPADEQSLSVLVRCLKVGQDLSTLKLEETIEPELARSLLRHGSSILRIDALSLLVTSRQGAKPVPSYVFTVLQEAMDHLFVEPNSGYRNQVVGLLRSFIFRIRGYSYALRRDADKVKLKLGPEAANEYHTELSKIKDFCAFFLHYLKLQLRPGSPYHCMSTATLLVKLLVQSGLDNSVESRYYEKQYIPFAFSIKIFDPAMVRLLVDNVTNNYEDIRVLSAKIMMMAPFPIAHLESVESLEKLERITTNLISGVRGREGDGAARLAELLFRLHRNSGLDFLLSLISSLETNLDIAKRDLIKAVHEHSLHGYFSSLRLIVEKLDFTQYNLEKSMVDRLLAVVSTVWEVVNNILCHDSPEGNLPEDLDVDPELEKEYGPATQLILSYSWRGVKESMALLKALIEHVPNDLLEDKDILSCGSLILDQLATIRHRGAFSSVYPTFVACCTRCNSRDSLSGQSEMWLKDNLNLIRIKAQNITRRSGGLPYLVTAVLSAAKDDGALIKSTFDILIKIAYLPAKRISEEKYDLPQVHAFNCIRAMFVEAELSKVSQSFLDEALELAIISFSSEVWAIRNCAVMLYTALQNHLFDSKVNAKVSSRVFFTRHSRLRDLLLNYLAEHVSEMENNSCDAGTKVEIVFPVLSLLSKVQAVNGYHGLDGFKPMIISCLKSTVWKIREMAAMVYSSIIMPEEVLAECKMLTEGMSLARQNELHGKCLAVLNLLENTNLDNLDELRQYLETRFDELVCQNPCAQTALAFFRLFKMYFPNSDRFVDFCTTPGQPSTSRQLEPSERLLRSESVDTALARSMADSFSEICQRLLFDQAYEVQLATIDFLTANLDKLNSEDINRLSTSLFNLFLQSDWDQVRGPAVRLFGRLCSYSETSGVALKERWETLYGSMSENSTEEINLACLEALGPLTGMVDEQKESACLLSKTKLFAVEDVPYTHRMAALTALCGFLQSSSDDGNLEALWQLYFFLSDDDADIRETCTKFCINYLQCGPATSVHCENLLIARMSSLDGFHKLAMFYIIQGGASFESQFYKALTPDSLLFSVEKQNLFRNNLNKLSQFEKQLALMVPTEKVKMDLQEWLETAVHCLMDRKEADGLLGWTSDNPDIFLVMSRFASAVRLSKLWGMQVWGKQANLELARQFGRERNIHELLIV